MGDLDKARRAVTPLGPEGRHISDAHVAVVEIIGATLDSCVIVVERAMCDLGEFRVSVCICACVGGGGLGFRI